MKAFQLRGLLYGWWKRKPFGVAEQHLSLLRNLSSLKLLNLSQNALEDLPPGLFHGLNLSVIDLSRNKLRTLNATQFDLESLTTLDLRGNSLTDATRRDLAHLKVELHVD